MGERWDDLMRCGYQILQDPDTFCFGMDAVLLSSFAKVAEGEVVLDLGTGNGIIPILLAAKTPGKHFTGIDIQPKVLSLAKRSIEKNNLNDKISFHEVDIKVADEVFPIGSFDVVTSNPPYMIGSHGLKNENQALSIARHEILCDFDDIIRVTRRLLRPKGRFYLVHRPFRLVEILSKMSGNGIEPKRMRLVHPHEEKEPNMVLIEGVRGGKPRLKIEKPLVVYSSNGEYTQEITKLYGF